MFLRPVAVRAALAAVVALLVTACTAHGARVADVAGAPSGSRAAPVTPARLGRTLPADPVRMVLPATGAETRWTQGLYVFGRQVDRAATADCARRGGFALPAEIPLAFIRFFALPDLDFIARHGLSASAEVPAPATAPSTARTGTAAEVRRCRGRGREGRGRTEPHLPAGGTAVVRRTRLRGRRSRHGPSRTRAVRLPVGARRRGP